MAGQLTIPSSKTASTVGRPDETNTSLNDYNLLPTPEIARTRVKKLRMTGRVFSNSSRLETLEQVVHALSALKVS